MTNIYILVILLIAVPIIFNVANKKLANSKYTSDSIALISSITIFMFSIVRTILIGYQSDAKLNSFDLNGDGSFSGDEITPEFHEAMLAWTDDIGITSATISGLIFCTIYYITLSALLKK